MALRGEFERVLSDGTSKNMQGHWFLDKSNVVLSAIEYKNNFDPIPIRRDSFQFEAEVNLSWLGQ